MGDICLAKVGCSYIHLHYPANRKERCLICYIYNIKYSNDQIDYLSQTSGGFNNENVSRRWGTCSTFSKSCCTRRRASPLEISLSDHRDGSLVPWYSKPKVTRAWRGWILRFIQSKAIASPVIQFCFRFAINFSKSGIWLVSRGFFNHSALIIGGPGVIIGRVFPWFSI